MYTSSILLSNVFVHLDPENKHVGCPNLVQGDSCWVWICTTGLRILQCFWLWSEIYMFYWWIHFKNEIPINSLFIKWKCKCELDLGSWRWSALNMGFVDSQFSRMQGQRFYFYRSQAGQAIVDFDECFFFWRAALALVHLPFKAHRERFNVPLQIYRVLV